MTTSTIKNSGVELYLESRGTGEIPMLFLHGLTFDRKSFASLLEGLPPEVNAWTLDFRGHGGSGRSAPPYLYTDFIDDTVIVIRKGIGEPVILFGHSLGGAVALAVAANVPRWVRGLIISDNFLTRSSYAAAVRQSLVRTLFNGLSKLASRKLNTEATAQALAELELPGPDAQMIPLGQFPGNSPEFLSLWANALTRCDPQATLMTLAEQNQAAFEGEAYLERLQCPLLLLQADTALGGMLPDEDVGVAQRIKPDLRLQRFPGAGHFMHLHDPKPTAKAVSAFVRG